MSRRHGPISHCPISVSETLVLEYLAASEDEQLLIERRFGRSNVLKLVANYQEEQLNQKLFDSSTKPCPGCKVRVEKSLGCNHVSKGMRLASANSFFFADDMYQMLPALLLPVRWTCSR